MCPVLGTLVPSGIHRTRRIVAGLARLSVLASKILIVPWAAGGTTDVALRALATATEKYLGQSIVVENRAGSSGTLGPANMAATAKPDGYTISQLPITVFRQPFMTKTSFDPTGFYLHHRFDGIHFRRRGPQRRSVEDIP